MKVTEPYRISSFLPTILFLLSSLCTIGGFECPEITPHNCTCTNILKRGSSSIECISLGLTNIPTDLPLLDELKIEDNNIPVLNTIPYRELTYLNLESNGIYSIPDNAFRNLTKLETLNLADNKLTDLSSEIVRGLTSLRILVLARNPLFYISQGLLAGRLLPNLENLDVANCKIYEISTAAFDLSSRLLSINASYNRISKFDFIQPLKGLIYLDLAHNRIESLLGSHFRGLTSLKSIDLSHNLLTHITEDSFKGLIRLNDLCVAHNHITKIDHSAFVDTLSLKVLDISHNSLQHLNRDRIPWATIDKPLVHNNPWECGCKTAWLRSSEVLLSNLESNLTCSAPIEVQGAAVYAINLNFFSCHQPIHERASERALAIGLGVVIGLIIAALAALLVYRLIFKVRRRSREGPLTVSASSPYSRVDSRELVIKGDDM